MEIGDEKRMKRENEWHFKSFKEGIKDRKLFLKHHQTVDPYSRAPQVAGVPIY